jgi:hypothetical protein
MPRDGGMGTKTATRPCGELVKALFVATLHFLRVHSKMSLSWNFYVVE